MSNSPPFSDSPRDSAFYPIQPNEIPLVQTTPSQVPRSNDGPELSSLANDRLSAPPGNANTPIPHRSVRNERDFLFPSSSAPSLQGSSITRPFPTLPESHSDVQPLTVEGSSSQNSAQQRVSFESNRASAGTPNHSARANVRVHPLLREVVSQTPRKVDSTRLSHQGDANRPSPGARLATAGTTSSPKKLGHESVPTASISHSRATSPIRLFSWSGFHHAHEDPFVPVDPFRIRTRLRRLSLHSSDIENHVPFDPTCEENPFCCFPSLRRSTQERYLTLLRDVRYFILDTLPRQIYLLLLLRLPSLYFSRIARVYADAQLSKPDLEHMIESYSASAQEEQRQRIVGSSPIPPGAHYHPAPALPFPDEWTVANVSPALVRFKQSWETFIDSLLREWKTLNLVSALLHSTILSMFQNQIMANDPIIRTAALLSLASATMSLSFGCIYIVRFGTMRSMDKATRWAEEAARTTTFILWNVWVLLAMPAIWLSWSMIFFIVAVLAFVWRYGSSTDPTSPELLGPTAAIGPRVAISALFLLGLLYLTAIIRTFHSYGRAGYHRLFSGTSMADGIRGTEDANARGEQSQRGRGGDRRELSRISRDRENTAPRREQVETGGLSAVTGLGLKGLDDLANSRSSDEMPAEKRPHREASV